jgi:hypothetical protein
MWRSWTSNSSAMVRAMVMLGSSISLLDGVRTPRSSSVSAHAFTSAPAQAGEGRQRWRRPAPFAPRARGADRRDGVRSRASTRADKSWPRAGEQSESRDGTPVEREVSGGGRTRSRAVLLHLLHACGLIKSLAAPVCLHCRQGDPEGVINGLHNSSPAWLPSAKSDPSSGLCMR